MNVKMNITVPTNFICRSRWHAKKGGEGGREGRRERRGRRGERENTIKMTSKSKRKENKKNTPQGLIRKLKERL